MRSAAAAICCRTLPTWESWVIGWVKFFTYWMNAWISPTVMAPWAANMLPESATPTYPRLPTKFITGIISPERNCDFQALS